jgi:hypothetical protein
MKRSLLPPSLCGFTKEEDFSFIPESEDLPLMEDLFLELDDLNTLFFELRTDLPAEPLCFVDE